MKLLFATTNPAKVKKYKDKLLLNGIELLTLNDIDNTIKIEENGKTSLENAYIKAKNYFDLTKIPTIGMDNSLYIENIPEDKQIGTHVRRINGKELNDEEMIDYYTNFVKSFGGKLKAKWVYGLVYIDENGKKEYSWSKKDFYFVDVSSSKRNPGYPLDSIAIIPEFNKYLVELTPEEKNSNKRDDSQKDDEVIEFILNAIK